MLLPADFATEQGPAAQARQVKPRNSTLIHVAPPPPRRHDDTAATDPMTPSHRSDPRSGAAAVGAGHGEEDWHGDSPDRSACHWATPGTAAAARTPSVQAGGWHGSDGDVAISDRSATGGGSSYRATGSADGTDGAGWVAYGLTGSVCDRSHHSRCRDMGASAALHRD